MYKQGKQYPTTVNVNKSYQGETIEHKINRIVNNKEPIRDGAPLIYTDRKEGVKPAYDVRTDRFEVAIDAMDKVTKTHLARREERHKPKDEKPLTEAQKGINTETEGQSTQATDNA